MAEIVYKRRARTQIGRYLSYSPFTNCLYICDHNIDLYLNLEVVEKKEWISNSWNDMVDVPSLLVYK